MKNYNQKVPATTSWLDKGDCNNLWKPKTAKITRNVLSIH